MITFEKKGIEFQIDVVNERFAKLYLEGEFNTTLDKCSINNNKISSEININGTIFDGITIPDETQNEINEMFKIKKDYLIETFEAAVKSVVYEGVKFTVYSDLHSFSDPKHEDIKLYVNSLTVDFNDKFNELCKENNLTAKRISDWKQNEIGQMENHGYYTLVKKEKEKKESNNLPYFPDISSSSHLSDEEYEDLYDIPRHLVDPTL